MAAKAHSLHPSAEREIARALLWYRREAGPAKAGELADAVTAATDRICAAPDARAFVAKVGREILRSGSVRPFPFRLIFSVRADAVFFVAFAHKSRRPKYWRGRLR